jgi:hypothetical protein
MVKKLKQPSLVILTTGVRLMVGNVKTSLVPELIDLLKTIYDSEIEVVCEDTVNNLTSFYVVVKQKDVKNVKSHIKVFIKAKIEEEAEENIEEF